MIPKILLQFKKLFKNPLGLAGKCNCYSELVKSCADSQDGDATYQLVEKQDYVIWIPNEGNYSVKFQIMIDVDEITDTFISLIHTSLRQHHSDDILFSLVFTCLCLVWR